MINVKLRIGKIIMNNKKGSLRIAVLGHKTIPSRQGGVVLLIFMKLYMILEHFKYQI